MNTVDYNIEFGHIYLNQINYKKLKALVNITKRLIESLDKKGHTYTLCVLIDDCNKNIYNKREDIKKLLNFLEHNLNPDFVVLESQLIEYAETYNIENRKSYRVNCSFLTFIWYMSRLGKIKKPNFIRYNKEIPFTGKRIISILHNSFIKNEVEVLRIMDKELKGYNKKINYFFYGDN